MNAETKHGVAVDVLAVLDEAADWLYRSSEGRGDDERSENVKAASVAVAKLIEAGKAMPTFSTMHGCNCETCAAIVRFNAALANAGQKS